MKKFFYLISFLFLAVIQNAVAQEAPEQNEFTIGSIIGHDGIGSGILNAYTNSGMNTAMWRADEETDTFLSDYNVMAFNALSTDWINHYATGYYSKWEAEEDQDESIAGVKHIGGQAREYNGVECWSTYGLTGAADSLMYGPHYSQSKRYWRAPWAYGGNITPEYTARFRMALDYDPWTVDDEDEVCIIKVVYRYAEVDQNNQVIEWHDTVFLQQTLKVSDFPSNGDFEYFYFDSTYQYPSVFGPTLLSKSSVIDNALEGDPRYVDWFPRAGIQFWVDWLGTPNVGTLYIDHAEVYDAGPNDTWSEYIETPGIVESRISGYVQDYSDWTNIKYWYAHDEPNSIDAFIPIRTVDSLVQAAGGAPLITAFWEVGIIRNNIPIYEKYYEVVQPKKLMFQSYPVWARYNQIQPEDFELLRSRLQLSHTLQPQMINIFFLQI